MILQPSRLFEARVKSSGWGDRLVQLYLTVLLQQRQMRSNDTLIATPAEGCNATNGLIETGGMRIFVRIQPNCFIFNCLCMVSSVDVQKMLPLFAIRHPWRCSCFLSICVQQKPRIFCSKEVPRMQTTSVVGRNLRNKNQDPQICEDPKPSKVQVAKLSPFFSPPQKRVFFRD